jgi:hypothetical protein
MSGQDESSNGESKKVPSQGSRKGTLRLLGQLEAEKESESERERQKLLKRKKQEARTEFNGWKKGICEIVEKESELLFNEETFTWHFIVPAKLSRFFYEIMLKEYVRAKKAATEQDAAKLVRAALEADAEES